MKHNNPPIICVFICLTLLTILFQSSTLAGENILSLERMGAGAPAGWKVSREQCTWTAESAPGPLGVGAGRFQFDGEGSITLISPAKALEAGTSFGTALWFRSEPAGATVSFDVRDNETEKPLALHADAIASDEWQMLRLQEALPQAVTGHYYLELKARGNACTLFMDGLWLGPVEDPLKTDWRLQTFEVGATLEPAAPWGVVTGDMPHRVHARVCGVTRPGAVLALKATNTLGETAGLPSVTVAANGTWEEEISITENVALPFGMLRVEAQVLDVSGKPLSPSCETLLARAPEPLPGPMPESYFGVHVSLREPDLEAVSRLGYKWCRIHDASAITKWGYVEPSPGQWLWHDEEVDLVRKHGLSILGMFDTAPAWETGAQDSGYFQVCHAPRDIRKWREYVRQMAGHYAGRIDEWEVWNEPWDMMRFFQGGSPFLYVDLLKAAYEEAKAANPGAVIVGVNTYPALWEDIVLTLGAYPWYDKLSWHRYDPAMPGRPGDGIARVARRLNAAQANMGGPPKPILCSEGGPDVGRYHGSFFLSRNRVYTGPGTKGRTVMPASASAPSPRAMNGISLIRFTARRVMAG